jgi:Biotin-requiring enzyme
VVAKGDHLLTIESMKMENRIEAASDGVIEVRRRTEHATAVPKMVCCFRGASVLRECACVVAQGVLERTHLTGVCVCVYARTYLYMCTYVCVYACDVFACMCVCTHVYVCVCFPSCAV